MKNIVGRIRKMQRSNAAPSRKHPNILLWINVQFPYDHALGWYVTAYVRQHMPWWLTRLNVLSPRVMASADWENIDGIIGCIRDLRSARFLLRKGKPFVDTSGALSDIPVFRVHTDDREIGKMAANYLAKRGLRSFGYVGEKHRAYSGLRLQGFRQELTERGHGMAACHAEYDDLGNLRTCAGEQPLSLWIQKLSKPAGVFCVSDQVAHFVSEVCRGRGISVPHSVALLGVDNVDLICNAVNPPLSSIAQPLEQIARTAVDILDALMRGQEISSRSVLVPPREVVERQSTNIFVTRSPHVNDALRLIHQNMDKPLTVRDVTVKAPVCRSLLERQFREVLGSTILTEIHRARVEHAKRLLTESNLSMEEIAETAGFAGASRLWAVFRKIEGKSPNMYRRQFRADSQWRFGS